MNRVHLEAIGAACALLLTGCVAATFKPGASASAMAGDDQACRSASKDENAYADCMRARGWYVSAADRQPTQTSLPTPANREPAPLLAATPTPIPSPRTSSSGQSSPSQTRVPAAPPLPAQTKSLTSAPLQKVDVGGWFKLGAGSADLDRAIDACVAKLGAAHRPDANATVVTLGVRECMRDAGWYPLKDSVPHD
ncbi:MAG TPA: hypothetical protein VMT89_08075 [Candidatus Acidoferrales bacterium]|nr:hypothetical protein [Candidatus Acidoferrales bacterium]